MKYGGHPWLRRATPATLDRFDRDDQKIADFTYRLAETAAKYRLFLDMHGYHKPAGIQRTYPNVLNFEGVFGLEQMKWTSEKTDMVTYDVTIPFIRMLAGPMDYTQGAMRNATRRNFRAVGSEAMSQGTRCRQLAEYVIFESPFNMLCDSPSNYMREPECTEFIASVPTTWDETVGLDGRVGEYVSIARRKGDTWYVGGMTDWNARTLTIDLGFLGEGAYTAELFRDGVNAESRSKNLKSTSYWLNKMRAEYFDGVDLDKDNEALFTAVTPAEVRRLAREILAQGNRYTAVFTQE